MKSIKPTEYLTEDKLYPYLVNAYGQENVKRQYKLSNRKIVDYFIESKKLAVEFDGYGHYQNSKTIDRDIAVHEYLLSEGIRCVHIPYWAQSHLVSMFYFGISDSELLPKYPNGFIDKNCVHPIDFSYPGWVRFVYEIRHLPTPHREEIRFTMTDEENDIFDIIKEKSGDYSQDTIYADINWLSDYF